MGRTYKKNDIHNSRRPKSIREKRNWGNKDRREFSTDSTDTYSDKYRKPFTTSDDFYEADWWMISMHKTG